MRRMYSMNELKTIITDVIGSTYSLFDDYLYYDKDEDIIIFDSLAQFNEGANFISEVNFENAEVKGLTRLYKVSFDLDDDTNYNGDYMEFVVSKPIESIDELTRSDIISYTGASRNHESLSVWGLFPNETSIRVEGLVINVNNNIVAVDDNIAKTAISNFECVML